jgi:hypothetical protein
VILQIHRICETAFPSIIIDERIGLINECGEIGGRKNCTK